MLQPKLSAQCMKPVPIRPISQDEQMKGSSVLFQFGTGAQKSVHPFFFGQPADRQKGETGGDGWQKCIRPFPDLCFIIDIMQYTGWGAGAVQTDKTISDRF